MNNETMKATLPKVLNHTGKVRQNRKEKSFFAEYSVFALKAELKANTESEGAWSSPIVTARLYGAGQRVYACVWVSSHNAPKDGINPENVYLGGGGFAGGYGYDKCSAAIQHAIDDTGIKLSQSIHSVGQEAIKRALLAIARAVVGEKEVLMYHVSNG